MTEFGSVTICGSISRMSSVLTFRTGKAVVAQENPISTAYLVEGSVMYIILSKLNALESLELFATYRFTSLKKSFWKKEISADISTCDRIWYTTTPSCEIEKLHQSVLPLYKSYTPAHFNSQQDLNSLEHMKMTFGKPLCSEVIDGTNLTNNFRQFLTYMNPRTIFHREMYSNIEINIRVKIYKFHTSGWIEIDPPGLSLNIYITHYSKKLDAGHFSSGNIITFFSLLPVYIWGQLRGFAYTIRSNLKINEISINHRENLAVVNSNPMGNSTEHIQKLIMVPKHLMNTCYSYCAWFCYLSKKLQKHLNLRSNVIEDVVSLIARKDQSNTSVQFNQHICPLQLALYQSNPQPSIYELCKLPERLVQYEFSDVNRLQLLMIRSGHDTDFLSTKFSQIVSCSEFYNRLKSDAIKSNFIANQSCLISLRAFWISSESPIPAMEFQKCIYQDVFLVGYLQAFKICDYFVNQSICLCRLQSNSSNRSIEECIDIYVSGSSGELESFFRRVNYENEEYVFIIKNPTFIKDNQNSKEFYHEKIHQQQDVFQNGSKSSNASKVIFITGIDNIQYVYAKAIDHSFCQDQLNETLILPAKRLATEIEIRPCEPVSQSLPIYLPEFAISNNSNETRFSWKMKSIREIFHQFQNNNIAHQLFGVILHKSIVLSDDQSSKTSQYHRRNQKMQCTLVLRDIEYPDIISVYVPPQLAEYAIPGAIVALRDCYVTISSNHKHCYGKILNCNSRSIGLLGFVSLQEMQYIYDSINRKNKSKTKIPIARHIDWLTNEARGFINRPPATYISILENTRNYDRCLWTLHVQIVAVKSLTVSLKCTACLSGFTKTTDSPIGFRCSHCKEYCTLSPYWSALFICEDGSSGEVIVECDGDVLQEAFRLFIGDKISEFQTAKCRIDSRAFTDGYCKYDCYLISRAGIEPTTNINEVNDHMEGDLWSFIGANNEEQFSAPNVANQYPCLSDAMAINNLSMKEDMQLLFTICDFSCRYDLIVKLVHRKSENNANGFNDDSKWTYPVYTKHVKIQEVDATCPYITSMAVVPTAYTQTLYLECSQVIKLTDADLRSHLSMGLEELNML